MLHHISTTWIPSWSDIAMKDFVVADFAMAKLLERRERNLVGISEQNMKYHVQPRTLMAE
jgi:hypothetical protein